MNPTALLLMTYNIHNGKDIQGRDSFNKIIRFIQSISPDILTLQEINENKVRGFQVSQIMDELNYHVHFGPNISLYGGKYGIATLTKLPMIKKQHLLLPSLKEQRGLIHSVIKVEEDYINIFNTHLGLNNLERKYQFKTINKFIHAQSIRSSLLMGDFNTTQPVYDTSLLYDTDAIGRPSLIGTNKKIDYIFVSKHMKVLKQEAFEVNFSDHLPLIIKISA